MDDARIQQTISWLDDEIPREGARVRLDQYGDGPDESRIIANKLGFLRLGLELLRGAYAPTEQDTDAVTVDIDYLLTADSSIGFDWFERREPEDEHASSSSRFAPVVILSVVAVLALLMLIGLVVVVRWLVG